jgi:sortase A
MVLKWIGRALIAAGVAVLLFVAYQLLGTNLIAKQSQKQLEAELRESFPEPAPSPSPGASPSPSPTPSPAPAPPPDLGSGIAIIEAPSIGLRWVVVEGVGVADLKKGPGHVPGTALPGDGGNMVISGHRTTYGAPFYRLDELADGAMIRLISARGTFEYAVTEQRIVAPTEVSVLAPTQDTRLTLTTCNPKFSAKQRLIIVAGLVSSAAAPAA